MQESLPGVLDCRAFERVRVGPGGCEVCGEGGLPIAVGAGGYLRGSLCLAGEGSEREKGGAVRRGGGSDEASPWKNDL